jgi:hypothetical protein
MMKRPRQPSLAELTRHCDAWNALYPIGTPVTVLRDLGREIKTRTRSHAQVLSNHSAVIWLDGLTGCYDLGRVSPRVTETASG